MKRTQTLLWLFFGLISPLLAQAPADSLHVAHYTIQLDLTHYQEKQLYGAATLKAVPKHQLLYINLELMQLQADSVSIGGEKRNFSQENDRLRIPAEGRPFAQGDTLEICVWYHGKPYSERFGGFYFSEEYAFNMGVCIDHIPHTAGKTWFPCVDSFTDKALYSYRIRSVQGHRAVCGGLPTDSTRLPDSSIVWSWEQRQPIPTYLASVACGPYIAWRDTLLSIDGRRLPIEINVHPSAANKVTGSFSRLKQIVALFENHFGPYPFDRIGYVTVPFTSGAMEHAGNIAYPLAAVDGSRNKESLYAHELSHAWFGDWVTCESAEEMWLNEGFATWCEGLVAEYFSHNDSLPQQDSEAYRHWFRQQHRNVLKKTALYDKGFLPLSPMPQEHTYGSTTYNKGSLTVYSLRSYMGDSLFFKCMKSYLADYGGGNITSRELFRYLAQKSGLPMEDFHEAWVAQPGFLHFSVDSVTALGGGMYRTHLRQRLYHADNYAKNNRIRVSYFFPDSARKDVTTTFSGEHGAFDCPLPQTPLFAVVDIEDRYADAVMDLNRSVKAGGTVDFSEENIRLARAEGDSGWVRIEHHWVPADSLKTEKNTIQQVSDTHYWRILTTGITFKDMYLSYEALDETEKDYALFHAYPKKNFLLLHRPDAGSDWRIVPFTQTGTNGSGVFHTNWVQNGEYCFGIGDTSGMRLEQTRKSDAGIQLYPNPADRRLHIRLPETVKVTTARIHNASGQLLLHLDIREKETNWDVSHLSKGMYFIEFMDDKNKILQKGKFFIK